MSFFSRLASAIGIRQSAIGSGLRKPKAGSRKPPRFRPQLEALEDRTLPSTFYAATASDLIADIKAANLHGGANTIVLTAPTASPYVLTAVDNTTDGPTVLPVITKGDALTIVTGNGTANPGYGDGISASRHGRLFDVAQGGSLTLENVTLADGFESRRGTSQGGAIYNQGTLVLSEVMIESNTARSSAPIMGVHDAAGGGIWSNGSLTVQNTVFQGNSAIGYDAFPGANAFGGAIYIAGGNADITGSFFGAYSNHYANTAQGAGSAYGGAIYVAGGTVTMSGDTVGNPLGAGAWPSNSAQGGSGWAYGGGLYVAGGSVTLTNDIVQWNVVGRPPNSVWGYHPGAGGGICIGRGATVYLDSFTWAHTQNNYASAGPRDIYRR